MKPVILVAIRSFQAILALGTLGMAAVGRSTPEQRSQGVFEKEPAR